MPYIGNQPFGKTVRTVTTETITSAKTAYYPNGGYMAGYVDVFVNGVRLSESLDFTATDGSLVTLLYTPNIGDTVEIVTYGSVEIANAVRRSGDTFSGNVYVGSNVYISTSTISVGNATVNTQITAGNIALNGSTLTIGNSTVNTVFTGDTLTLTGTANLSTAINVGANVSMNTTSIRVGNSTINTYIVSDTIYGPSTLYIDPAAAGDNTGLVVVKGDLQVDGTTFTINSANVTVNDKNVVLASGAINNAATDGAGLTIYGTNANLTYNATGNNFEMSRGLSVTGTANVSVALNVGANVNLSTSQINVGNSTVNTVISATALTTTSNTSTFGTAVYISANGNVGVGTSSPSRKLQVQTTGANSEILVTTVTSGNPRFGMDASGAYYNWIQTERSSGAIQFAISNSEAMRLDASGNLGLGVTPSASWGSGLKAIQIGGVNGYISYNNTSGGYLYWNMYNNGTNNITLANGNIAAYGLNTSGAHVWFNGTGTINTTSALTQAMTLDASGRLMVGVTSNINTSTVVQAGGVSNARIGIDSPDTQGFYFTKSGVNNGTYRVDTNGNYEWYTKNVSQAMILDVSGNLLVGTTTANAKVKIALTGSATTPIVNVASFGAGGVFSLGSITNNSEQVYLGTGDTGGGGIAAGIGFMREASGWNSALAFYTNSVTSGANGVSAVSEKMRLDSSGNLTVQGNIRSYVSPAFSLSANQHTDILYIGAGGYGAIISGILTVYSTYSGAVTQNSYAVNVIGNGSGTGISMISQGNYSTPSSITVYDRGSVLGGGSRVISVFNASGVSVSIYYSFVPTGQFNSAGYYASAISAGTAGVGTGIPSGTAVYYGQDYAQIKAANIIFPAAQSASSDANTLDDYEEGTFTPAFNLGTWTYVRQQGWYRKVGSQVTVWFLINWSATSNPSSMNVKNFPFTSISTVGYRATGAIGFQTGVTWSASYTTASWLMSENYASADLGMQISGGSSIFNLSHAGSGEVQGTITYITT